MRVRGMTQICDAFQLEEPESGFKNGTAENWGNALQVYRRAAVLHLRYARDLSTLKQRCERQQHPEGE